MCVICQKANPEIERLTHQIKQLNHIHEKANFARQLLAEVDAALKEHGSTDDPVGKPCQNTLLLRKQTAELILRTQKLAD